MKHSLGTPVFFWLLFVAGHMAMAQEKVTLTFNEAVARALKENIDLKTQQNELLVNEIEKARSYAQFAPQVSAFAQLRRQNGNQFIPQQLELINTVSEDFYPQVQATLSIFNGFSNINGVKAAKLRFAAQQSLVSRTRQDIIFNVSQQYLSVLLDQELVKIARENIELQQQQLQRIKSMVEAGVSFVGDQYNQEAQIKALELALVQAINTLENDKSLLARILVLQPGTRFELVEPAAADMSVYVQDYNLEELYQQAVTRRADLEQQKLIKDAARHEIKIARSGYYPTLQAQFSYDSYYNSTNRDPVFDEQGSPTGSEKVSFWTQVRDRNPNRSVSLRLNIPIFSRLDNKAAVTRSQVAYQNAELQVRNIKNAIYIDVQTALQDYEASVASYQAAMASFEAAKLAYDTQRERYQIGLANVLELTTASGDFIQASVDLAQAKYTLIFQNIIIDYHTGVLHPDLLPDF